MPPVISGDSLNVLSFRRTSEIFFPLPSAGLFIIRCWDTERRNGVVAREIDPTAIFKVDGRNEEGRRTVTAEKINHHNPSSSGTARNCTTSIRRAKIPVTVEVIAQLRQYLPGVPVSETGVDISAFKGETGREEWLRLVPLSPEGPEIAFRK